MQGGEVDLLAQFSPVTGEALLTDQNINVIELRASQHRQLHMRTDKEPFTDKRVRQAVALLINRDNIVQGLLEEKSDYGNDSPFAPVYPVHRQVGRAAQAGRRAGQGAAVRGRREQPQRRAARLERVRDAAVRARWSRTTSRQPGIDVKLNFTDAGSYYGDAVFGKSPWLDSTFGLTEYGHRGVPNVFLGAPLTERRHLELRRTSRTRSTTRSSATTSPRSTSRRSARAAKKIQEMLLDEVADRLRLLLLLPHGDQAHRRRASTCRRWATSTSSRRARRPERGRRRAERGATHRPLPRQARRPRPDHAADPEHRDLPGRAGAAGRRRRGASSARSPIRPRSTR